MTLTAAERKRLAGEARKLADEIADGRVPELRSDSYCGCAAHVVATRAGLDNPAGTTAEEIAALQDYSFEECCAASGRHVNLISEATHHEVHGHPGALVFPLLALADALEAA